MYQRRSTPIHRSLHEVKSTAGGEFVPTVANFALAGVFIMGPHFLWWPVVTYFMQRVLQWSFKREPQAFEILRKYMGEGDLYDPWPRPSKRLERPDGIARGIPLC